MSVSRRKRGAFLEISNRFGWGSGLVCGFKVFCYCYLVVEKLLVFNALPKFTAARRFSLGFTHFTKFTTNFLLMADGLQISRLIYFGI